RYSGRPGADVSQADGPGPTSDPGTGSRNIQTDRGSRGDGAEAYQSIRLCCARPSRPLSEAARRAGTVRPRDPRQKNREPGKIYEEPPPAVQTSGTIKHVD